MTHYLTVERARLLLMDGATKYYFHLIIDTCNAFISCS